MRNTDTLKCIHIMLHPTVRHNESIIKVINDLCLTDVENHYLVFKKDVREAFLKMTDNVFLGQDRVKAINECGKKYDYIFLHAMELSPVEVFKVRKNILKKIIWVCWGHDLYINRLDGGFVRKFKNFVRKVIWFPASKRLKNIYGIGLSFKYDIVGVAERFGNMRIIRLPYGYRPNRKKCFIDINGMQKERKESAYKIMVGHSGYEILNHIEILKKLSKFKNENIIISLVLAYGEKEYTNKVISFAKQEFDEDKLEIILNEQSYEDYMRYISGVDIGVFDQIKQSGLGNINALAAFGKKLYLNRKGILKIAMDFEYVDVGCIDEIDDMSFEEFTKPCENINYSVRFGITNMDESLSLRAWNNIFKELKVNLKK